MLNTERLDTILANHDGRHVDVLCGAGISLGSGLPSARQFLDALFAGLGVSDFGIDSSVLCDRLPFEAIVECATSYAKDTSVLSMFGDPNIHPGAAHALLMALLANGVVDRIFTTNFDLLFEKSAESSKLGSAIRRACVGERRTSAAVTDSASNLVKLHGSADDIESMKITLSSIADRKNLAAVSAQVGRLFPTAGHRRLIVLGYSCSDHFDVVPSILALRDSDTEVLFVQHTSDNRAWAIQDIATVPALGPNKNSLAAFAGYHVAIDTTVFLEHWGRVANTPFAPRPTSTFPWQSKMASLIRALRICRGKFLGTLFLRLGEYASAEGCYRRALAECAESSERPFLLNQLALLTYNRGNIREADQLIEEAFSAARTHDNASVESALHELRAEMAINKGRYPEALAEYEVSANIRRRLKNHLLLAKSYQGMGVVYRHLNDIDRSIACTNAALRQIEQHPDFDLESDLLCNKGELLGLRQDFPEAKVCVTKAIGLKEKTGDQVGLCSAYTTLGTLLKNAGDRPAAVEAYTAAVEIGQRYRFALQLARAHFQLAVLYSGVDVQKMAIHLQDSIAQFRAAGDDFGLAKCDSLSAQLALHVSRSLFTKAKAALSEADEPEWSTVVAKLTTPPRFPLADSQADFDRNSHEREIEHSHETLARAEDGRGAVPLYLSLGQQYEDYAGRLLAASVRTLKKFSVVEADLLVRRFGRSNG